MRAKDLRTRLYLIAAIILLVGLSSAVLIYLKAETVSEDDLSYQLQHSKKYRHDMEVIGGKANVLIDDFNRWLDRIWHGKPLAYIVTCITVVISFGFSFVAYHLPPDSNPHAGGQS